MGARIIRELNCRYVTFGFSEQADIRPLKYAFSLDGVKAVLQTPRGKIEIQSRLLGRFNLLNIMAAVSSALVKGVGRRQDQRRAGRRSSRSRGG